MRSKFSKFASNIRNFSVLFVVYSHFLKSYLYGIIHDLPVSFALGEQHQDYAEILKCMRKKYSWEYGPELHPTSGT
jgi:hypothetical protein